MNPLERVRPALSTTTPCMTCSKSVTIQVVLT